MTTDNPPKKKLDKSAISKWDEYLKPFEDLKIEIRNIYYPELEYEKNIPSKPEKLKNKIEPTHEITPSRPVEIPLTMSASLQEVKEYFKPYDPLEILPLQENAGKNLSDSNLNSHSNKEDERTDKPSKKVVLTVSKEDVKTEEKPSEDEKFANLKTLMPKDLGMPSLNDLKNKFETTLKNVFKNNNFFEATYESLNMTKDALETIEDVENILDTTHSPIERYMEVYKRKINSFFNVNDWISLPSKPLMEGITGVVLGKNKQGVKTSSLTYEKGKLSGPNYTYYPNGSIKEKMSYEKGQLNGLYETYDEEGKLVSSLTFEDGKLNGPGTFYDHGRKTSQFEFVDGIQQGSSNTYYESGSVMTDCTYSSGKMEGDYKVFNDQGNLSSVVAYKDGKKDGKSTSYYTTGEILETGTYITDLKDGTFITYYQNGNPNEISEYQSGKLTDLPVRYTLKGREIDS